MHRIYHAAAVSARLLRNFQAQATFRSTSQRSVSRMSATLDGPPTNRRRSARQKVIEVDEMPTGAQPEIKMEVEDGDEIGVSSSIKAEQEDEDLGKKKKTTTKTKRGLQDVSAAVLNSELRRSKRVKSSNPAGQDVKSEAADEEEDTKKLKSEPKPKRERKTKKIKSEDEEMDDVTASPAKTKSPTVKTEKEEEEEEANDAIIKASPSSSPSKLKKPTDPDQLRDRKLKSYAQFAATRQSPYPDFARPTPSDCALAHRILTSLHGERHRRPIDTPADQAQLAQRAGCGDAPTVLDALVRTILSQNTSDRNSTRAKLSMDSVYGSSANWDGIVSGGQAKLEKTIASGGLAGVKSRVIIDILEQTKARYGKYSLDHLFEEEKEEGAAMRELISFKGVGPKTASCVLLFCLRRPSFAVDTHVYRIAGLLGWRPGSASRDLTHAHLDVRIPDELKYPLHLLMVKHGKECGECKAGGKVVGRCELRKAFRGGKGKKGEEEGVEESEVKEEEEEEEGEEVESVKAEDDEDVSEDDVKM